MLFLSTWSCCAVRDRDFFTAATAADIELRKGGFWLEALRVGGIAVWQSVVPAAVATEQEETLCLACFAVRPAGLVANASALSSAAAQAEVEVLELGER